MANVLYPKWKEALLTEAATNAGLDTTTIKVVLIDLTAYTYAATDQYLSDIPLAARISTATVSGQTVTNGLLDANNTTFPNVTGPACGAVALYVDTGDEATSRLIAYYDTGVTGLPVSPIGTDIPLAWNASGIFQL